MPGALNPSVMPTVAIVGRPNVGKSTLFNRLIGKKYAITSHIAGTTRDRVSQATFFGHYKSIVVDTGGLDFEAKGDIEEDVRAQAKLAIDNADLIYFVVDASAEMTKSDFEAADLLRKSNKSVFLVGNKIDGKGAKDNVYNFYQLGFGDIFEVSSLHEIGLDALQNRTAQHFRDANFNPYAGESEEGLISMSFLGRPNVGKSSLVNALLREERVIVSPTPGTTIDTTDTEVTFNDQKFNLIDTAGLRRRGHIDKGIERYSSFRALQAVYRSDIAFL